MARNFRLVIKNLAIGNDNGFCHRGHKEHRERQRRKLCYGNDYGKNTENGQRQRTNNTATA
jgi:hypothetical protein